MEIRVVSSLSIFLCNDLMLQCSKERSFDINLSTWLTKSICVAYCERGSDRLPSERLLLLVKHPQSGNNCALNWLESFIYAKAGSTFFALLRQHPCVHNSKTFQYALRLFKC